MPKQYAIPVYGHRWAQDLLRQAILSGATSHAYLFSGPAHIGKDTLALAFAQSLTCTNPIDEGLGACGQCRSCRLAAQEAHPDHRIIRPGNGKILVDSIREVIREATMSPIEGRYKVFVISAFELANISAANALLKTLEEPSASTRLLLTSSQAASLLPTITSRCQIVNLRPLARETVAKALVERWGVPDDRAHLLAGLSRGRLGWAVEMATQEGQWEAYEQQIQTIQQLTKQGAVARMALAADLAKQKDVTSTLQAWLLFWRDVWLLQQGSPQQLLHHHHLASLQELAAHTHPQAVRSFLTALQQTMSNTRTNVNVQLAMEALLLKVPTSS